MSLEKNDSSVSIVEISSLQELAKIFNNRIDDLAPLPMDDKRVIFSEKEGFSLRKLMPAVMRRRGDGNLVLLAQNRRSSGYEQGDHPICCSEYDVNYNDLKNTYTSFVLEDAFGNRVLLVQNFFALENEDMSELIHLHDLSLMVDVDRDMWLFMNGKVNNKLIDGVFENNFGKDYLDKLMKDDLYLQIAKNYDLSIFEWLRLRLTGEF